MKTITVNTANGTRTLTAAATEQWNRWLSVNSGNTSGCATISTDHPMIRHSPNPLKTAGYGSNGWMIRFCGNAVKQPLCWPEIAGISRYCETSGEFQDWQGCPPSPDHYFVGS